MNRTLRNLLAGAVTGLVLVLPACTDPSTAPASTVSGENIFKDERSYLAFLAKIYAGMATTVVVPLLAFVLPVVDADSAVLQMRWGTTVVPMTIRARR